MMVTNILHMISIKSSRLSEPYISNMISIKYSRLSEPYQRAYIDHMYQKSDHRWLNHEAFELTHRPTFLIILTLVFR